MLDNETFEFTMPEDVTPTSEDETQETTEIVNEENGDSSVEDKTVEDDSVKAEVKDATPEAPFMTIKFNHESMDLSKEEAIELAQKGKNYDVVNEKYEALKGSESFINEINRLAKANNMSVEDYVKNLTDVQTTFEINKEVEALREMYPNSDEALLEELAKSRLNDKASLVSKKEQDEKTAKKQEITRQMNIFAKRHPNIDPSKLDKSVYLLMEKEGYTLSEAYETFVADQKAAEDKVLESQAKIKKQNDENKARSLGNMSNQETETLDEAGLFAKYLGI